MYESGPFTAIPESAAGAVVSIMAGAGFPSGVLARTLSGLAAADVHVLLQGEPGTRRRDLAEAIHRQSPRHGAPFFALAIQGASETQLRRELFGVAGVNGAITRPRRATLYLDGIEALPLSMQLDLLSLVRAADGEGGVRIIASTAVNLEDLVRARRFLGDLYYRIALIRLAIPPLRERPDDIVAVADQVVRRWCMRAGKRPIRLAPAAVATLKRYPWPGNERELQLVLETVLKRMDGASMSATSICSVLKQQTKRAGDANVYPLRDVERDYIAAALVLCNWNQSIAAQRLGIGRNTLLRKIKSFKLERSRAA